MVEVAGKRRRFHFRRLGHKQATIEDTWRPREKRSYVTKAQNKHTLYFRHHSPAATTHSHFTLLTDFPASASLPLEQMASVRSVFCISQSTGHARTKKWKTPQNVAPFPVGFGCLSLWRSWHETSHRTGALSSWVEDWQPAGFENGSGIAASVHGLREEVHLAVGEHGGLSHIHQILQRHFICWCSTLFLFAYRRRRS